MALSQIVPVCCDQLPLAVHSCINQGNAACDTRFRWKLREYGATVVTRPISFQGLYDYSPCTNETEFECPVSRESFEFNQSSTAFLGWPNPLPIYSNKLWMVSAKPGLQYDTTQRYVDKGWNITVFYSCV